MKKDLTYYLSHGYPPEVAEYFVLGAREITNVVANDDYTIIITYNNGVKKLYDIKPFMKIKWFKRLENLTEFKKVQFDNDHIFWDDMTDLCGDTCYIYGLTLRSDNA